MPHFSRRRILGGLGVSFVSCRSRGHHQHFFESTEVNGRNHFHFLVEASLRIGHRRNMAYQDRGREAFAQARRINFIALANFITAFQPLDAAQVAVFFSRPAQYATRTGTPNTDVDFGARVYREQDIRYATMLTHTLGLADQTTVGNDSLARAQ